MQRVSILFLSLLFISCVSGQNTEERKILKLIDIYENGPIDTTRDYRNYSLNLMQYCISGGAFCLMDSIVTPWINDDLNDSINGNWASVLIASYYAGCIKQSSKKQSVETIAFAGNAFVNRTYNKIKKLDTLINIPFLDSLNHHDYRENFEKICRNRIKEFFNSITTGGK